MNVVASAAMFDHPALDVAIGLIFLYVILAVVCTTVNEMIMTALGMRARFLEHGLRNIFSATAGPTRAGGLTLKKFFDHPLTQTMVRPKRGRSGEIDPTKPTSMLKKPPYPSYLPSRTFVSVLLDLTRDTKEWHDAATNEEVEEAEKRMGKAKKELERSLASIPNKPLAEALLAVYRSVDEDATKFHHAAEQWYDDTMERVSGWYKRRVQLFLLVIAALIVVPLNADSISAANVLWKDDVVRTAVVKQAEASTQSGSPPTDGQIKYAVKNLALPLGWNRDLTEVLNPSDWDFPDGWLYRLLSKLAGLGITVAALMLGAPFWFDLLSKIMRVRSTGAPPPATDAERTGEGDQPRRGSTKEK